MSNTKVYVVMQRDYEYNDEVYSSNEGGNNVIGYMTSEAAEKEALCMNIEDIKKNGGYQYLGYETCNNFNYSDELEDILQSIHKEDDDGYTFEDLEDYYHFEEIMNAVKNLSDDQIEVVVDSLCNPQYYVESVEVVE